MVMTSGHDKWIRRVDTTSGHGQSISMWYAEKRDTTWDNGLEHVYVLRL